MRGEIDGAALARARAEQRIVVTHDRNSGESAVRAGVSADCGAVLFRRKGESLVMGLRCAVVGIESRAEWAGHFRAMSDHHSGRKRPASVAPSVNR